MYVLMFDACTQFLLYICHLIMFASFGYFLLQDVSFGTFNNSIINVTKKNYCFSTRSLDI